MLGTPVGFGDYEQRKSVELLTKKLDSLPALRTINPHCAIRLLDRCVNQRVQYLSRTSEFEGARYIFRYHFDQKIDEFLANILGEVAPPPLPPPAPGEVPPPLPPAIPGNIGVHRTLPRKLGGPGIMAYGGPAGEAGVSESRELTLLFLESFHPFLCEATNRWLPLPLTEQEGGLGQQLLAEADAVVTTAKAARNAILRKWANDIHARLLEDETTHSRAAWFLSGQFGGSARWITWHGGLHGTFRLTPLEFRDSLRLLFVLPPLELTIGYHRYCDCNVDVDAEPLHVLDCVASLHKYNRRRYDAVVRALVTYITQCLGS